MKGRRRRRKVQLARSREQVEEKGDTSGPVSCHPDGQPSGPSKNKTRPHFDWFLKAKQKFNLKKQKHYFFVLLNRQKLSNSFWQPKCQLHHRVIGRVIFGLFNQKKKQTNLKFQTEGELLVRFSIHSRKNNSKLKKAKRVQEEAKESQAVRSGHFFTLTESPPQERVSTFWCAFPRLFFCLLVCLFFIW